MDGGTLVSGQGFDLNASMTNPEKPETIRPTNDIADLLALMRVLRDPQHGCPWDRAQSFATVAPYTIEEAYEVAGAIEDADYGHLKEELGDLLFQTVFHARMAEELGLFDFGDVVEALIAKMIARHPHVFGNKDKPEDADAQTVAWDALKKRERTQKNMSILDDVPRALPALLRAVKLQKRASSVGFDWHNARTVLDKVAEEAAEVVDAAESGTDQNHVEEEVGDLLFVMVNLARHLKVDPEKALRVANAKFTRRFSYIETEVKAQNRGMEDASLEEMEALWQEAKRQEKQPPSP